MLFVFLVLSCLLWSYLLVMIDIMNVSYVEYAVQALPWFVFCLVYRVAVKRAYMGGGGA